MAAEDGWTLLVDVEAFGIDDPGTKGDASSAREEARESDNSPRTAVALVTIEALEPAGE